MSRSGKRCCSHANDSYVCVHYRRSLPQYVCVAWPFTAEKNTAHEPLSVEEGSVAFGSVINNFLIVFFGINKNWLSVDVTKRLLPPRKSSSSLRKMYLRDICLFRSVDKLVEAQLAEHEPPKLAGWARFPIGSYRRLNTTVCFWFVQPRA